MGEIVVFVDAQHIRVYHVIDIHEASKISIYQSLNQNWFEE
jgi:hypothetical protein